jgi:DNA replication and repair protein RecF
VRVTGLSVRDFRNYERAEVELAPGLNVVTGPNGAGKTNLLEALYVGLTGRSCRTSNDRELVRIGEKIARVETGVAAPDGLHELEVGIAPGEEKRLRVDGAALQRGVDPPRPLAAVFLPDRLDLVKGAPALRRAHLDQVVAALWPARVATRSAYTRALAQRNALIARVRAGMASPDQLDPWDAELASHGAQLMADRAAAVELVAPTFASRAEELGLPERAGLRYSPRSKADGADGLRAELGERRTADLDRGFTTHGPHRDDLALTHGGRALRTLGSQGQQRLGLLALLFAERDALAERGTPPLMLLDDVMSELDSSRRERLSDLVRADGQAMITTTDADHVPESAATDVALFQVTAGRVERAGSPGLRAA